MPTRRWHLSAVGLTAAALTVAPLTTGTALAATGTNTVQTSTGWAGYQADSASAASVAASWTVPAVTCGSSTSAVDFEAGLGTTPVAGIVATCNYGFAQYHPWISTGMPSQLGYTTAPGDVVSASGTYDGPGDGMNEYTFALADQTQNWSYSLTLYSSNSLGTSAQAGIEPDTIVCEGIDFCFSMFQGEPLANFGTVNFTGATISGGAFGGSGGGTDQTNLVSGGSTEAATSSLDGSGEKFSVSYQG